MTSLAKALDLKAVLAAMAYLATFLAISYGLYASTQGGAFLEAIALAYPIAFIACALLFAGAIAFEARNASLKKTIRSA